MSALLAAPGATGAAPLPSLRLFRAIPESEALAFAKLAREILRGHIGCDAERLGNDLYRCYGIIADMAATYHDYARQEAALAVLDDLVALPDETEEACAYFVAEREAQRRERAAERLARQRVAS